MTAARLGIRRFGAVNGLGLFTLMKREASRGLSDYNYQLLGPAVTALLYIAVFRLALHNDESGQLLINFITPGVIIFTACEKAYESAAGSFIFDKHERIIADMLMAPLTPFERLVGYVSADCLGGIAVGVAVAVVSLIFAELGAAHPWAIVAFALLGMIFHSLVGLLVGIWAEKFDHLAAITNFIVTPLSFLSGTFYSTTRLPEIWQTVAHLNPFFYMIDGFRYGFIGHADAPVWRGVIVMLIVDAVLLLLVHRWLKRGYRLKA